MDPRALLWRLATLAWAAHMFYLSTGSFSTDASQSLLRQLLNALHVALSPFAFSVLHVCLRKLAHLAEYSLLCFLLYRAILGRRPFRWCPRSARWCLGAAIVYALTDELHQAFVSGRGASLIDCGIDIAGALLALSLLYGSLRRSERRLAKPPVKADAEIPLREPVA